MSGGAWPRGGVPPCTREPGCERHERGDFWDRLHDKWHDTSCPIRSSIRPADRVAIPQAPTLRLTVDVVSSRSGLTTPGLSDVTSTRPPRGVGEARGRPPKPGDPAVAEVEGIGRLPENPAEARP
jgi:hypothetical protein